MTSFQLSLLLLFGAFIMGFARHFPGFALLRPVALLVSLTAIVLAGLAAFVALPVELMPNNSFGIITITTPVRGGMSPAEIERQITKPIEESVSTVSHLRNLISNSTNGKSVVSIEFEPGTNMDFATLDVREKFSKIKGDLPNEIEPPIIAHYRESDVPIHIFALTSGEKTPEQLRTLVDRELKEKLLRVKGVANVEVAGGRERKIIIDVDKNRLFAHGYDIRRLVTEIEQANVNVKTGELRSGSQETTIRATGQYANVEEIANTVIGVTPQGSSLYVRDVAQVRDDFLEQESLARLNSSAAVTLYIQKDSNSNTVRVVKGTQAIIKKFKETMPADIEIVEISNQAEAILAAVGSVRESLLIGVVLIFLVLGFFLGTKPAAVVAVSIPLSALLTGALMYLEGFTLNVMTLSGLALGIGLLVDNAIVVLEIILQKRQGVQEATESLVHAILGGTLTSIVVFVPFFVLSKQLQLLYSGMAVTITLSLLSSLYIALTTVPYLTKRYLMSSPLKEGKATQWLEKLQDLYRNVLPRVIEKRRQALGAAFLLFVLAAYLFQFHIDKNFSMGEESGEFIVFVELPSGKRLDLSDRVVKDVENRIRTNESTKSSIKTVTTRIEGWSSKVYVTLKPPRERSKSAQEVIDALRPVLEGAGKEEEAFVYFSSAKTGQEITINVYGEEEKTTADYAMQIAGLLEQVPGFVDTKIRYRPGRPEVKVIIDSARASLFGLDPTEVGNVLHAQTRGLRATYFREAGEEVETIVRLQVDERNSIDAIKALLIQAPNGAQVPLAQIARFDYSLAPSEIWRNNKERMVQVSANLKDVSLENAAGLTKGLLLQIPFNTDYWAEIGGDYHDRVRAESDFQKALLLTCLLIFAVLACLFESLLQPLLLFISVPLSAIGIALALLLTGTPLTMGAMIGILMTGGIVVNHAILYMDHFNHHRTNDLVHDLIQAGTSRLRPILMTKATTVLGLLPMALDRGDGAELWRPMAITTIGGLLSSAVLTLFVLPALIYAVSASRHSGESRNPGLKQLFKGMFKTWAPAFAGATKFLRHTFGLLFFMFVIVPAFSEPLPPWVDTVVNRRVNDLLAEARTYEKKKDYARAIEINLEAVRLAPQNEKARESLLRVNEKSMAALHKDLEKRRHAYVSAALDRHRGDSAWQNALAGKTSEAERLSERGHVAAACDRYYQILDEAPHYRPAVKGLENLQLKMTRDLGHGGHFSSEDDRQVAQGFWYFNQGKWQEASDTWAPLLADANAAKKWGDVRLGVYASRAEHNRERDELAGKIQQGIDEGLRQFRDGDLVKAESAFQSVLALDPENQQAKEYARMIPGLKARVRSDVMTEMHEKQMANTLADALDFYLKGFYDEAETKVDLVLKEEPQHPQALALNADIQKARGLAPVPTLEEKMTEEKLKIEQRYSDGIIAFAEGRMDDAKIAWTDVLKADPAHPRAQQALKKIEGENK